MSKNSERISMMQSRLTPLSQKVEQQRHLSSIKKGMMDINPILLLGSVFSMLLFLSQLFTVNWLAQYTNFFELLIKLTFNSLALYLSISISYHHSKQLETPLFYSIFLSVISVTIVHAITLHSANFEIQNVFIGIVVSLITVELINKINLKKESVKLSWIPTGSKKTFILTFFSVFYLICLILLSSSLSNLGIMMILKDFFNYLLIQFDTPIILFIIVFFEMLLWFIGLNGYSILAAIVLPIATDNLIINNNLLLNGGTPTKIFTPNFWDYFVGMSGSGLVGALAVLALFSKVSSLKEKGKLAIVPSIFHISEPILYGLPIAYNPYFFIPFVIGTPVLSVLQWYVFKWGLVNLPSYHVADLPLPIAQILSTMDFRAVILVIVIFILSILMYYPFFKRFEKSVIESEAIVAEDNRFKDLDLDF